MLIKLIDCPVDKLEIMGVCMCVTKHMRHTWGRAWTTVSRRALIPVAIFSSFSTGGGRTEGEREGGGAALEVQRWAEVFCNYTSCIEQEDWHNRKAWWTQIKQDGSMEQIPDSPLGMGKDGGRWPMEM